MAIYRFRISFEDFDDVIREIDVLPKQTFLDLHNALHAATGYNPKVSSSFYVSNDQWKKGNEIAYLPDKQKVENHVILMEDSRLNKFIDDPHQKFYYVYNFDKPFDFHVQLIKILKEEEGKVYPALFKSVGQTPKPYGTSVLPMEIVDKKETDDYDFLNETEYGIDEAEDFDMLDEEEQEEGKEGNGEKSGGYEEEF
ncbi:plasmid pRiA4b ORF-3 family protein [Parapedobacter tibetensis]|uniref:plasmid pRiA4b ORF-3 family protein n=1 Tax=Parapedobacter tibetensis TaxID=2972951 RepID=UPI00214DBBDC|nr:plasmid pRiA4b ORF-3 family protein [Parapedobacter tibetensis]